jgi:hypothetical protein
MNGVQRTAKLVLDPAGTLKGEVKEVRIGDRARLSRHELRNTTKESDMVKPVERMLADSLPTFQLAKSSVSNLHQNDQPFILDFSFEAPHYAKNAGNLLLIRPRVLGVKTRGFLETKEPRRFAIEFRAPTLDTDTFEITLPPGYEVDELPDPVNADYSFADYHSKTEVTGRVIRYTRTYEIKELSVPTTKADEVKRFYRTIAGDERNMVVLKPSK